MARMLPPYISEQVKSTGERQIFDLFKNDPGTEDWVVLHSLGLMRHAARLYGEIDFLVLAPSLGIFCLEIKSGDIRREEGIWRFMNRFGEVTTRTRGPFQQAEEGMFSLITAIKNKFGETSHLTRLLYGFGVMFPHVLFQLEGTDIEWWQIYDRDSRRLPVRKYIEQLSNNFRKKVGHSRWFDEVRSIPSKLDIDQLVTFLRGDFERLVTPRQMLSDVEAQLNEYTTEQYRCLDEIHDNPRCLFQGAAGTGKTMIAMESVHRNLFENHKVLMVCFNSILGKWLQSQFQSKELYPNLTVGNFHHILGKLANISEDAMNSSVSKDDFFKYELPLGALDAIDKGKLTPFDTLIIDEGQDIIRPEYLDVFEAMLKGGLAGGKWQIFCDFERQAIYSEYSASEMLGMLESRANFTKFRLTINCRNTRPIGEEINILSGFRSPVFLPGKVEGIPVEYYFYRDSEDEVKQLETILVKLRRQKIPAGNVTLLSPFRLENSCVININKADFQIRSLNEQISFPMSNMITYSTIHGFKGLENSYIILTDINRINDDEFKSLLYVGMSRAKVGLIVLMDEQARRDYNELLKKSLKSGQEI
ncbi:ATP-binding domain-containing protein [Chloroflexota bacterium]